MNALFKGTDVVINNKAKLWSFTGYECETPDNAFYVMVNRDGTVSIDLNEYDLDVTDWKWSKQIKTTSEMKQKIITFNNIHEANTFLKQL